MSDEQFKADVERIAALIPFDPDTRDAWQRLRARLEAQPDRERVAKAIQRADAEAYPESGPLPKDAYLNYADAAIAAIRGETK